MATPTTRSISGTGYKQLSMPRLSPEQMSLFQNVMGGAQPGIMGGVNHLSQLASGGSPEMWAQLEAPAMTQFAGLQGNLASRFSGMGSGARRSSGFQNTMTGAASDLAQSLASRRLGMQQDAISQLMGLYGNLMGTQTQDTMFMPKKKPWWAELLGGLGGAAGQAAGMLPMLAMI